jgi:hydrogenase maturation protein HypF
VLLTGGCFLNKYLFEKSINRLTEEGFKVYTQQRVPSGDGGISLGQMKFSTYIN